MLRDDIELLSGRIVDGPLTPTLYLLLKDTGDMKTLCKDLNIERGEEVDHAHGAVTKPGTIASGGLSFKDWLSNNAQPVSI